MRRKIFFSAELEIVPAGRARDCGFDRSMIMAYGQDDRGVRVHISLCPDGCGGPGQNRLLHPCGQGGGWQRGATGMHSRFFENTVAEILALKEGESELKLRRGPAEFPDAFF